MSTTFNKLISYLRQAEESKLEILLSNISNDFFNKTWLITETLNILDDSSIYNLTEHNMVSLMCMLRSYVNTCIPIITEEENLYKLLRFYNEQIYYITAANGVRVATTGEIAQGVKNLFIEYKPRIDENDYKKMCLLQWTINGKGHYYKQSGHEIKYDNEGRVCEDTYTLIKRCSNELVELFSWLEDTSKFEHDLKVLKKASKAKPYKYPSYAPDEVTDDLSIKSLLNNASAIIKPGSSNIDYRRTLALLIKAKTKKLEPIEISFIRTNYEKYALDVRLNGYAETEQPEKYREIEQLKKECELILEERYKGKIRSDHFAYKIISTLRNNHYTKCSSKQYNIIKDALNIINLNSEKKVIEEREFHDIDVISEFDIDSSLEMISDMLGDDADIQN